MDIERAINIAKGCVKASLLDSETKQMVIKSLDQMSIPKTETPSCEKAKTKIEKKYDHYRSYAVQGDCFKYVCSCNDCGQPLWEIEDYNYFKGERGYKPQFCPNCGRRLEEKNHGSKENY